MHNIFSVLGPILIVLAIVYLRMVKLRGGRGGGSGLAPDRLSAGSREAELEDEIADLRRRIAVLERIATDDRHGRSIAAEIEALRD